MEALGAKPRLYKEIQQEFVAGLYKAAGIDEPSSRPKAGQLQATALKIINKDVVPEIGLISRLDEVITIRRMVTEDKAKERLADAGHAFWLSNLQSIRDALDGHRKALLEPKKKPVGGNRTPRQILKELDEANGRRTLLEAGGEDESEDNEPEPIVVQKKPNPKNKKGKKPQKPQPKKQKSSRDMLLDDEERIFQITSHILHIKKLQLFMAQIWAEAARGVVDLITVSQLTCLIRHEAGRVFQILCSLGEKSHLERKDMWAKLLPRLLHIFVAKNEATMDDKTDRGQELRIAIAAAKGFARVHQYWCPNERNRFCELGSFRQEGEDAELDQHFLAAALDGWDYPCKAPQDADDVVFVHARDLKFVTDQRRWQADSKWTTNIRTLSLYHSMIMKMKEVTDWLEPNEEKVVEQRKCGSRTRHASTQETSVGFLRNRFPRDYKQYKRSKAEVWADETLRAARNELRGLIVRVRLDPISLAMQLAKICIADQILIEVEAFPSVCTAIISDFATRRARCPNEYSTRGLIPWLTKRIAPWEEIPSDMQLNTAYRRFTELIQAWEMNEEGVFRRDYSSRSWQFLQDKLVEGSHQDYEWNSNEIKSLEELKEQLFARNTRRTTLAIRQWQSHFLHPKNGLYTIPGLEDLAVGHKGPPFCPQLGIFMDWGLVNHDHPRAQHWQVDAARTMSIGQERADRNDDSAKHLDPYTDLPCYREVGSLNDYFGEDDESWATHTKLEYVDFPSNPKHPEKGTQLESWNEAFMDWVHLNYVHLVVQPAMADWEWIPNEGVAEGTELSHNNASFNVHIRENKRTMESITAYMLAKDCKQRTKAPAPKTGMENESEEQEDEEEEELEKPQMEYKSPRRLNKRSSPEANDDSPGKKKQRMSPE